MATQISEFPQSNLDSHKHFDTQNLILHDSQDFESDLGQLGEENNNGHNEVDLDAPETPRQNPARTHCLPARF